MIKKLLLFSAALVLFAGAKGQSAKSVTVQVGPVSAPGFSIKIEKEERLVQNALNQRLKEADMKTQKLEGYTACLDQLFADIASFPINLYTKVERDGKNKCIVTVCAFPTDLTVNKESIQTNTQTFLEGFVRYVNRFEARGQLEEAQSNLKKAQKKLESAESAVAKIEKNIKEDQEDIAEKTKEIEKYSEKIRNCQADIKKLEEKIAKRQEEKTKASQEVDKASENVSNVLKEVERYQKLSE
jgi:flagellar biosynthesis chaperone FliJ